MYKQNLDAVIDTAAETNADVVATALLLRMLHSMQLMLFSYFNSLLLIALAV